MGRKVPVTGYFGQKGIGVTELLDKVLLEAEMLELKANPKRRAVGSIIESSLDKGRGYVATVLVQNGTLKVGDILLAGTHYGKVKAMFNERNQRITEAGPVGTGVDTWVERCTYRRRQIHCHGYRPGSTRDSKQA